MWFFAMEIRSFAKINENGVGKRWVSSRLHQLLIILVRKY